MRREDHTGAVTHHVYDGDDLVLEVDGAGNRIREYTYFPGIDHLHSMRQWANGEGGAIYYYQMQKPGHVSGLVNTSSQLVNEYRYTPFGTPVNGYPVQGTPNPLQYMAREMDAFSELYYVRNRWYDPQQGRFVSEDPIGLAGGINQYAYVANNPLLARDPLGLCFVGRVGGYIIWFGQNLGGVAWIDECAARDIADYNEGWNAMYGGGDWQMPHHRQFGNPRVAAGPHRLSPAEEKRLNCLLTSWLSAGAREVADPVLFLVGNLGVLINDPNAQAVAQYPTG